MTAPKVPLNDFKAAVSSGLTARQIAAKFGVARSGVYSRVRTHNLSLVKERIGPERKWGDGATVDYKHVVALREQGWTYKKIGDELGISKERVRQILHGEGRSDLCGLLKQPK